MADLIYTAICSLDGFVADQDGEFRWSQPSDEVHAHVNDLARPVGTYLLGRRMYDVLRSWSTAPTGDDVEGEYASLWQAADKVVYSTSLTEVATERTVLRDTFDPPAVRTVVDEAEADVSIGGPHLAAHALRAGIVDEVRLYLSPVVVGAGNHALPAHLHLDLDLLDEHRFTNGVVFLRYRVR
jgi:dihydrofolate reductase